MSENPKPKRRLFSYNLRTLLVFVTIASAAFGWLGVKVRQAQRQRAAVQAIRSGRGHVWYDYEYGSAVDPPQPPGPEWLRELVGVDMLANVVFAQSGPERDANVGHIAELNGLKGLYFNGGFDGCQVTDAGLAQVARLNQLEWLDLRGTRVTDAGLVHLQGLNQLKVLLLCNTHITDAGLAHLGGLSRLEKLDLFYTKVTDRGLGYLKELKQLRRLDLTGTEVTDAGCDTLRQDLPNLEIHR